LLMAHLRQSELDNAQRELTSLAGVVGKLVDRYLDTHRVALNAAASLATGYDADTQTTAAAVAELRISAPTLRNLDFLDLSGHRIDEPGGPPLLSERALARRAELLATGSPSLEPPQHDLAGRWSVRLAMPVDNHAIAW